MKSLLVGESNPYGHDPAFALYPLPLGCAGHRLCHVVLGMTKREYLATFDRVNLLSGPKWSAPRAREAANRVFESAAAEDRPLVLLGARVAAAFGFPSLPFVFFGDPRLHGSCPGVSILVLPHPSARGRVWNKPGTVERARKAVRHLLGALR